MKIEKLKGQLVKFYVDHTFRIEQAEGTIKKVVRRGVVVKVDIAVSDDFQDYLPESIYIDEDAIFAKFNKDLNQWYDL